MEKISIETDLDHGLPGVLITGATGFVGSALCARLGRIGIRHRRALRHFAEPASEDIAPVGDIGSNTDWRAALQGISSVIHLAGRAHVMHESGSNPLAAYRETNVEGTRRLAEAAAEEGVKRFIFLSSIKVNGERTDMQPFLESDEPRPEDAYGISKLEAEQELTRIASESEMGITVIRPPLVYGPGVKGNFLSLIRAVHKGVPLPLASIMNSRSLVCVENLVSAITTCLGDARAAGQTFLVADGEDLSTPELIRRLAGALGSRLRLYRCPLGLLRIAGTATGSQASIKRLTESLQVDSSKIRRALDWKPALSVEQGLSETARWFVSNAGAK